MSLRLKRLLGNLLIAFIMVTASNGQRGNYPRPPAPAIPDQSPPGTKTFHRLDTVEMEREARELSALASSVPGDIDLVKKGLLPKDAVDKLKRIEKLSRRLRGQIQP
ncbi:MAG TPA: hypothetical protein VLT90_00180 [Terriglobales bacterium]|nr:hypothetical protein [Terriglobales bacterium]